MRIGFRMTVKPLCIEEYTKRHNPIWAELEATLLAHGVLTYSIFHDAADGSLFGYAEIEDLARWNAIAQTEVCQRWWHYMKDLMPTHDDHSPVSRSLQEVFVLRKPSA